MRINLRNKEHLEAAILEMKKHKYIKKPYKSFYPLKRIKGTIKKVHRLGMNSYSRFLYVNPIEGLLISYQNQSNYHDISINKIDISVNESDL